MKALRYLFPAVMMVYGLSSCGNRPLRVGLPQQVNPPLPSPTSSDSPSGTASFAGTQADGNGNLSLNATGIQGGAGSYDSVPTIPNGSNIWKSLTWTAARPYDKELPPTSETAYSSGNANMTGLKLLYHFNETAGARSFQDVSTSKANAACTSCPASGQAGKFNGAVRFDGTQSAVDTGTAGSLSGAGAFSISAWVNTSSTGAGVLVQQREDGIGGDNGTYQLFIGPNTDDGFSTDNNANYPTGPGVVGFWTSDVNGGAGNLKLTTKSKQKLVTINDGKWHHLAAVREVDGAGNAIGKLYVDGALASTSPTVPADGLSATVGVHLGYDARRKNKYLGGLIDEMAVFSRALSAQEVADFFERGALRIKLQVQTCGTTAPCTAQGFMGPDGTAQSFYSELMNASAGIPTLALVGLPVNPFFQYRVVLESDLAGISPLLPLSLIVPGH